MCVFWAVLCGGLVSAAAADDLVFVQVLHRHGDRGPVSIAPAFAKTWADLNVEAGQLTPTGVAQQMAFGAHLREIYGEHLNLSATYHPSEVSARSTAVDRTIGSAYSLLRGLYPDHIVPIPVYTVPVAEDFVSRFWASCPSWIAWMSGIDSLLSPNLTKALGLESLNAEFQFPSTWDAMRLLGGMYDNLECMDAHNITSEKDESTRTAIRTWAKKIWYARFSDGFRENSRGVAAAATLREFANNARSAVAARAPGSTTSFQKIKFYSAHDTTLIGLHDALGLLDEEREQSDFLLPGYSNSIIFELRRENDRHMIRIKRGSPSTDGTQWYYSAQPLRVIAAKNRSYSRDIELDAWLEYVDSLRSFESGCCAIEEPFRSRACADQIRSVSGSSDGGVNQAAVTEDPVCNKYAQYCPTIACGTDAVFSQPLDTCLAVESPSGDSPGSGTRSNASSQAINLLAALLTIVVVLAAAALFYQCRQLRKYRAYGELRERDAAPDSEEDFDASGVVGVVMSDHDTPRERLNEEASL